MRARAYSPCHFSATPWSHEVIRRAPERELHRQGAQPFASASKYFRRPPASLAGWDTLRKGHCSLLRCSFRRFRALEGASRAARAAVEMACVMVRPARKRVAPGLDVNSHGWYAELTRTHSHARTLNLDSASQVHPARSGAAVRHPRPRLRLLGSRCGRSRAGQDDLLSRQLDECYRSRVGRPKGRPSSLWLASG